MLGASLNMWSPVFCRLGINTYPISYAYCYRRATSFTRMTKTGIESFVLYLTKDGKLLCTNFATQGLTQSPIYFEIPTRPTTLNFLATLSHNTTVWSSNRINPPRLCVPSFPFRVTPPRLPTESPENTGPHDMEGTIGFGGV